MAELALYDTYITIVNQIGDRVSSGQEDVTGGVWQAQRQLDGAYQGFLDSNRNKAQSCDEYIVGDSTAGLTQSAPDKFRLAIETTLGLQEGIFAALLALQLLSAGDAWQLLPRMRPASASSAVVQIELLILGLVDHSSPYPCTSVVYAAAYEAEALRQAWDVQGNLSGLVTREQQDGSVSRCLVWQVLLLLTWERATDRDDGVHGKRIERRDAVRDCKAILDSWRVTSHGCEEVLWAALLAPCLPYPPMGVSGDGGLVYQLAEAFQHCAVYQWLLQWRMAVPTGGLLSGLLPLPAGLSHGLQDLLEEQKVQAVAAANPIELEAAREADPGGTRSLLALLVPRVCEGSRWLVGIESVLAGQVATLATRTCNQLAQYTWCACHGLLGTYPNGDTSPAAVALLKCLAACWVDARTTRLLWRDIVAAACGLPAPRGSAARQDPHASQQLSNTEHSQLAESLAGGGDVKEMQRDYARQAVELALQCCSTGCVCTQRISCHDGQPVHAPENPAAQALASCAGNVCIAKLTATVLQEVVAGCSATWPAREGALYTMALAIALESAGQEKPLQVLLSDLGGGRKGDGLPLGNSGWCKGRANGDGAVRRGYGGVGNVLEQYPLDGDDLQKEKVLDAGVNEFPLSQHAVDFGSGGLEILEQESEQDSPVEQHSTERGQGAGQSAGDGRWLCPSKVYAGLHATWAGRLAESLAAFEGTCSLREDAATQAPDPGWQHTASLGAALSGGLTQSICRQNHMSAAISPARNRAAAQKVNTDRSQLAFCLLGAVVQSEEAAQLPLQVATQVVGLLQEHAGVMWAGQGSLQLLLVACGLLGEEESYRVPVGAQGEGDPTLRDGATGQVAAEVGGKGKEQLPGTCAVANRSAPGSTPVLPSGDVRGALSRDKDAGPSCREPSQVDMQMGGPSAPVDSPTDVYTTVDSEPPTSGEQEPQSAPGVATKLVACVWEAGVSHVMALVREATRTGGSWEATPGDTVGCLANITRAVTWQAAMLRQVVLRAGQIEEYRGIELQPWREVLRAVTSVLDHVWRGMQETQQQEALPQLSPLAAPGDCGEPHGDGGERGVGARLPWQLAGAVRVCTWAALSLTTEVHLAAHCTVQLEQTDEVRGTHPGHGQDSQQKLHGVGAPDDSGLAADPRRKQQPAGGSEAGDRDAISMGMVQPSSDEAQELWDLLMRLPQTFPSSTAFPYCFTVPREKVGGRGSRPCSGTPHGSPAVDSGATASPVLIAQGPQEGWDSHVQRGAGPANWAYPPPPPRVLYRLLAAATHSIGRLAAQLTRGAKPPDLTRNQSRIDYGLPKPHVEAEMARVDGVVEVLVEQYRRYGRRHASCTTASLETHLLAAQMGHLLEQTLQYVTSMRFCNRPPRRPQEGSNVVWDAARATRGHATGPAHHVSDQQQHAQRAAFLADVNLVKILLQAGRMQGTSGGQYAVGDKREMNELGSLVGRGFQEEERQRCVLQLLRDVDVAHGATKLIALRKAAAGCPELGAAAVALRSVLDHHCKSAVEGKGPALGRGVREASSIPQEDRVHLVALQLELSMAVMSAGDRQSRAAVLEDLLLDSLLHLANQPLPSLVITIPPPTVRCLYRFLQPRVSDTPYLRTAVAALSAIPAHLGESDNPHCAACVAIALLRCGKCIAYTSARVLHGVLCYAVSDKPAVPRGDAHFRTEPCHTSSPHNVLPRQDVVGWSSRAWPKSSAEVGPWGEQTASRAGPPATPKRPLDAPSVGACPSKARRIVPTRIDGPQLPGRNAAETPGCGPPTPEGVPESCVAATAGKSATASAYASDPQARRVVPTSTSGLQLPGSEAATSAGVPRCAGVLTPATPVAVVGSSAAASADEARSCPAGEVLGSGDDIPAAGREKAGDAIQAQVDAVEEAHASVPPTLVARLLAAAFNSLAAAATAVDPPSPHADCIAHPAREERGGLLLAAAAQDPQERRLGRQYCAVGSGVGAEPDPSTGPYASRQREGLSHRCGAAALDSCDLSWAQARAHHCLAVLKCMHVAARAALRLLQLLGDTLDACSEALKTAHFGENVLFGGVATRAGLLKPSPPKQSGRQQGTPARLPQATRATRRATKPPADGPEVSGARPPSVVDNTRVVHSGCADPPARADTCLRHLRQLRGAVMVAGMSRRVIARWAELVRRASAEGWHAEWLWGYDQRDGDGADKRTLRYDAKLGAAAGRVATKLHHAMARIAELRVSSRKARAPRAATRAVAPRELSEQAKGQSRTPRPRGRPPLPRAATRGSRVSDGSARSLPTRAQTRASPAQMGQMREAAVSGSSGEGGDAAAVDGEFGETLKQLGNELSKLQAALTRAGVVGEEQGDTVQMRAMDSEEMELEDQHADEMILANLAPFRADPPAPTLEQFYIHRFPHAKTDIGPSPPPNAINLPGTSGDAALRCRDVPAPTPADVVGRITGIRQPMSKRTVVAGGHSGKAKGQVRRLRNRYLQAVVDHDNENLDKWDIRELEELEDFVVASDDVDYAEMLKRGIQKPWRGQGALDGEGGGGDGEGGEVDDKGDGTESEGSGDSSTKY